MTVHLSGFETKNERCLDLGSKGTDGQYCLRELHSSSLAEKNLDAAETSDMFNATSARDTIPDEQYLRYPQLQFKLTHFLQPLARCMDDDLLLFFVEYGILRDSCNIFVCTVTFFLGVARKVMEDTLFSSKELQACSTICKIRNCIYTVSPWNTNAVSRCHYLGVIVKDETRNELGVLTLVSSMPLYFGQNDVDNLI